MAGESMRFRSPSGRAGLVNNLVALGTSLAIFLESRISLVARESKTAFVHLFLLAGALVAALMLLAGGYFFLLVAVVFGIAHATGISWIWIALGAALLHFLLAAGCAFFARVQMKRPMFAASLAELKEDRAWLKNQTNR